MFIFPKKLDKNKDKNKQKYFFFWKGSDKVWPCSYLSPLGMENQDYVALWIDLSVDCFEILKFSYMFFLVIDLSFETL